MALIVLGAPLPVFPGKSLPCESWTDVPPRRSEERAQRHFHGVANGGVGSQRHVPNERTPSDQRFLCAVTSNIIASHYLDPSNVIFID